MYLKVRAGIVMFMIFSFSLNAQVQRAVSTPVTDLCNGFYEYLPEGYGSSSQTYPLLIFIHGLGELGNGTTQLNYVLRHGPPKMISQGIWPSSFTSGGQSFKFIVISPQFTQWPGNGQLNNVIDYAVSHYQVDINRIYLTGLSMGGGVVWSYSGGWNYYANRIAAIVPICGASSPATTEANIMAAANLPVWATHNNGDPTAPVSYTNGFISLINSAPTTPNPLAKKTIFTSNSHDAWTATYNLNFKEDGMNIFEWMLQYKRNFAVLPVRGLQFNATKNNGNTVALNWSTQLEINSRGFAVQRSTDGIHFTTIGFVNSTAYNGGGASYSFIDNAPSTRTNYYRLEEQEFNNEIHYSETRFVNFSGGISFTIYPNPAADQLNINSSYYFVKGTAVIYAANGQQVMQQKLNGSGTIPVNIASLQKGTYFLSVTDGLIQEKFRFVKQ